MDAILVSSTVSWCGPEPSSPSSISCIAVATITHLHLHGAVRQLRAEVEERHREPETAAAATVIIGDLLLKAIDVEFSVGWGILLKISDAADA